MIFACCLIGLVIEEITEEVETVCSGNHNSSYMEYLGVQPRENGNSSKSQTVVNNGGISTNVESMQALKNDPEAIRFVCVHKRVINCFVYFCFYFKVISVCHHNSLTFHKFGIWSIRLIYYFYCFLCWLLFSAIMDS
jgi:hypothetical protein